jgi:hypothetical protein
MACAVGVASGALVLQAQAAASVTLQLLLHVVLSQLLRDKLQLRAQRLAGTLKVAIQQLLPAHLLLKAC